MSAKRSHVEIDPDYEDVSEQQNKRQRFLEKDAKETAVRKIETIVKQQFQMEIEHKESEIVNIGQKLEKARCIMDRLRACIVASYYSTTGAQFSQNKTGLPAAAIHPTVKKLIRGKAPRELVTRIKEEPGLVTSDIISSRIKVEPGELAPKDGGVERKQVVAASVTLPNKLSQLSEHKMEDNKTGGSLTEAHTSDGRSGRFKTKKRIIVGNVSKYIPVDKRDENDQATHKWMVYVRGSKDEPKIDHYVKKVWFFLHPSYRPNDLVEVSQPPFHLTRRGWGEFPVRIQLHFKDIRNKRVDIIHQLKLDRTYTGLQTLGAETVVDIELEKDLTEIKQKQKQGHPPKVKPAAQRSKTSGEDSEVTFQSAVKSGPLTVQLESQPDCSSSAKVKALSEIVGGGITNILPSNLLIKSADGNVLKTSGNKVVSPVKLESVDVGYGDVNNAADSGNHSNNVVTMAAPTSGTLSLHQILSHNSQSPLVTCSKENAPNLINIRQTNTNLQTPQLYIKQENPGWSPSQLNIGQLKVDKTSTSSRSSTPTNGVQVVLKGMGSIGASTIGNGQGPSPRSAPVSPSTPKRKQASRTSSPRSASKVQRKNATPSPNTVILQGMGSITGSLSASNLPTLDKPAAASVGGSSFQVMSNNAQPSVSLPTSTLYLPSSTTSAPPSSSTVPVFLQGIGSISALPTSASLTVSSVQTLNTGRMQMPVSQPVAASTVLSSAQPLTQTRSQNQQGMIFFKCTDNQGKSYLIPQQLYNNLSQGNIKGVSAGQSFSNSVKLPLPRATTPQIGTATVKQENQSKDCGITSVAPNIITQVSQQKQAQPNLSGQVVFIQQDQSLLKPAVSGVAGVSQPKMFTQMPPTSVSAKPQIVHPVQPVRLVTPTTAFRPVNTEKLNTCTSQHISLPKTGVKGQITSASQSGVKGQLKVTSQGLINVESKKESQSLLATALTSNKGNITLSSLLTSSALVVNSNKQKTTNVNISKSVPAISSQTKVVSLLQNKTSTSSKSLLSTSVPVVSENSQNAAQVNTCTNSGQKSVLPPSVQIQGHATPGTPQSSMIVLQSKQPGKDQPNHLVIVPITSSHTPVTMTTGAKSSTSSLTSAAVTTSSAIQQPSKINKIISSDNKTMLIVVQDGQAENKVDLHLSSKVSLLDKKCSLLNVNTGSSQSVSAAKQTPTVSFAGRPNVCVINSGTTHNSDPCKEKKIMRIKTKYAKGCKQEETKETIKPLSCRQDYPDMLSLVKTAVIRHPVVCSDAAVHLHPYCARNTEDWLSWNVGKRRASEWQRASSVRKFIKQYLDGAETFQGEQLWTTKEILSWCRLHAYSPHYLEKALHPTVIDLHADSSLQTDRRPPKFSSLSCSKDISEQISSLIGSTIHLSDSEDELEIVSVEHPIKVRLKQKPVELCSDIHDCLPSSDSAIFVQDEAQKIGVKLQPTEVVPGCYASVTADIIYQVMNKVMEDVLRKTFAQKVNVGRYPDGLGVKDVHKTLQKIKVTDFLTNKFLGMEEPEPVSRTDR